MVIVALEQGEPPGRRSMDDDLAMGLLPAPVRWREGPGLWSSLICRKSYIADKVNESLDDVHAVVVLGAGFDTLAYRLARKTSVPIFEVDQPVNIARKASAVQRVLGAQPSSIRLVPLNFQHDNVLEVLIEHGYRPDSRTFFV